MSLFNGYVALGTSYNSTSKTLAELQGGAYSRQAVSLIGTFQSGFSQTLSAFGLSSPTPTGLQIRNGAIFDAATGGNLLCHWNWGPPFGWNTDPFPSVLLNITITDNLAASSNVSSAPVAAGTQIGVINGNPLIASAILAMNSGAFFASGAANYPTALPNAPGIVWNNSGVLSVS